MFDNRTVTVDVLMAAAAVPGLFPPVEVDGVLLVDGGITGRAPAGAPGLLVYIMVDDAAGSAMVEGDPVRLTQLLRTLMEYANARGRAAASVGLLCVGDRLRIDVHDADEAGAHHCRPQIRQVTHRRPIVRGNG